MTCLVCDKPLEQRGDRWVCDRDGHVHVELAADDWAPCDCYPHGPDDPCTCTGCWACEGRVIGCTCDINWDCEHRAVTS